MAGFTTQEFRQAMGQFATGVTIVTTADASGAPAGFTANSFTSVSLEPPLVLVCVDRRINSHERLVRAGAYNVHVLGEDQSELAQLFARSDPEKFTRLPLDVGPAFGLPKLPAYLAWFECRVVARYPGGDHSIFLGEVVNLDVRSNDQPLVFFRGQMTSLAL